MKQLHGNEEFTHNGKDAGFKVIDFWSWAYSDLLNNTSRGVMAEFLVYQALTLLPPPVRKCELIGRPTI